MECVFSPLKKAEMTSLGGPGLGKVLSQDIVWVRKNCHSLNRRSSAVRARAAALGAFRCKKPQRFSFLIRSVQFQHSHVRKTNPTRQAKHESTVVIFATSRRIWGKAYIHVEDAQEKRTWSRWALIPRSELITTPITLKELTISATLMSWESDGRTCLISDRKSNNWECTVLHGRRVYTRILLL